MTDAELAAAVSDPARFELEPFPLLRDLARALDDVEDTEGRAQARELVIRAREHRDLLNAERPILDALVRQVGLFPYLDPGALRGGDALAYEIHRPLDMPDDVVFHAVQARVYRALIAGESLILAAPTSFGKSLVIDALVASGRFDNVLIIVPTIALIDETRIRLSRFRERGWRLVTHPSQRPGERNLFVMTQERVLEHDAIPDPDLLVVDEFYKLDPAMDSERSALLNQAFYRLGKRSRQIYMLGPNVSGIADAVPTERVPRFIQTDYTTVALDIERVKAEGAEDKADKLAEICRSHSGPTLIYVNAPASCRRVADALVQRGIRREPGAEEPGSAAAAADWLAQHVHPDWGVLDALRAGIGVHHAQMPRWLGQYCVRAFNRGELPVLICTSTLIEGVNTSAKNVVVYENRIGRHGKKLDRFSFNNIRGRAGRMRRHFVGRVFHFDPAPKAELAEVDIPILSQSEDAPAEVLLELDEKDRSDEARARIELLLREGLLPEPILRQSPGVPPERQISLARELADDPDFHAGDLGWTAVPDGRELRAACRLIWEHLVPGNQRRYGVSNAAQLAARIGQLHKTPSARELIRAELLRRPDQSVDTVVEDSMSFLRHWQEFDFPKLLRCLDTVAGYILGEAGRETGDFTLFASMVERFFAPAFLATLDEYGIPLEVARRLAPAIGEAASLDDVLDGVQAADLTKLELTAFERYLVESARATL